MFRISKHACRNFIAILLVSSLVFIPPCTGYVNWIYPTAGSTDLTYNYIDTVYFTWTSNITNPTLGLWCAAANNPVFISPPPWASTVPTNGTTAQSFPYSKYFNGTCHMDLYSPEPGAVPGISSPNFLLAYVPTAAAQTWGLSATSLAVSSPAGTGSSNGTAGGSSGLSKSALSAPTGTGSSKGTAGGSSGLSKSAQAVVAIVCTIGGLALVIWVLFCVKRQRKRKLGQESAHLEERKPVRREGSRHELRGKEMLAELEGTPRAELSTTMRGARGPSSLAS